MNMTKNRNLTEDKITISIHNPDTARGDVKKLNTMQNKASKYDNPFRVEMNTTNKKDETINEP